jgi:hypothetical protein
MHRFQKLFCVMQLLCLMPPGPGNTFEWLRPGWVQKALIGTADFASFASVQTDFLLWTRANVTTVV